MVANKTSSWGFEDGGSHSLIGNLNARRKSKAKWACTSLLTDKLHTAPGEAEPRWLHSLTPHPLCGYLGVWRITWLLPLRPQSSLFCTPISLKREGRRAGEAMLYYFYTYPEIWAFNLSLICMLLVATGLFHFETFKQCPVLHLATDAQIMWTLLTFQQQLDRALGAAQEKKTLPAPLHHMEYYTHFYKELQVPFAGLL